ncbi:serine/threonine-protein kinase [Micromonospora globbae]|uniref:non-specific serine/threonine protein kinase n=1 Tax=Micromonospora globbae TaxID=1894969 RepID=A0A420F5E5_9ACTN|nr:serine/threonine-protein kinase [Micromonospora globbae]RKF28143.1 serine/threonine protein kinase [Micromonospora globbae]
MSNALPQLVADRYRLISPLGQGGMGRVWKARDEVLHRDVAIKELVPPPSLTDDERREMRERSLREARAIARLNHINVVRIFDVLRTDGDPWIVMEYVPSKSLQDTIAESGPVSPARAVEIGLGVLGALKAAHRAGVMHRDVKPGNVLLGHDGRVVLTDFGLATIPGDPNVTRTGMVLGSPAYIAPERARDGTAGPEADLWSLGATLYAAVEGKSPYARPSAIATLAALATEPLPPPKNAGPLKPVLQGLLRKDPSERITAEVAERMLRRASGRRARGISLLDGVRRPGPNGPRVPRPTVVPAPRPAERAQPPAAPPAPRTPPAPASPAADATAKMPAGTDAAPTAKVDRRGLTSDAEPTRKVDRPSSTSDADPTTKVDPPTGVGDTDATTADPARAGSGEADRPAGALDADRPAADADATAKVDVPAKAGGKKDTAEPADERRTGEGAPAFRPVTPTSVLPGLAAGGTATGSDRPSGRASIPAIFGTSPERRRRNLLVGALVVVLLLGLAVIVPLLTSGDDPEGADPRQAGNTNTAAPTAPQTSAPAPPPPTSAAPSATASPTPTASPTDTSALPAGWRMHRDPAGFALPIPEGWRRSANGSSVIFTDPNGVGELLIQWTDHPKKDAYADWKAQEPYRKGIVRNYQYLSIERCDYYRTCADWDWLETRDGTRIHVRNRGFVTASNRGYAIRWEVAANEWEANLPHFDLITKRFVPDRVDR